MTLNKFRSGWQTEFEPKLQILFNLFPNLVIDCVKRHFGMLSIKGSVLDKRHQYIVDCVMYKIERESSRVCEICGNYGIRKTEYLPEMMCLCWKCYALEIDSMDIRNTEVKDIV